MVQTTNWQLQLFDRKMIKVLLSISKFASSQQLTIFTRPFYFNKVENHIHTRNGALYGACTNRDLERIVEIKKQYEEKWSLQLEARTPMVENYKVRDFKELIDKMD